MHHLLRSNTDSSIATAATIALYNRHLVEEANPNSTLTNSSNNNRLLISKIAMNNGTEVIFLSKYFKTNK